MSSHPRFEIVAKETKPFISNIGDGGMGAVGILAGMGTLTYFCCGTLDVVLHWCNTSNDVFICWTL